MFLKPWPLPPWPRDAGGHGRARQRRTRGLHRWREQHHEQASETDAAEFGAPERRAPARLAEPRSSADRHNSAALTPAPTAPPRAAPAHAAAAPTSPSVAAVVCSSSEAERPRAHPALSAMPQHLLLCLLVRGGARARDAAALARGSRSICASLREDETAWRCALVALRECDERERFGMTRAEAEAAMRQRFGYGDDELATINTWRGGATGDTRMIDAARRGAEEESRALLALGGDVHATNAVGWTVMHAAARAGHARLVPLFAGAGAAVDARSANSRTPLHWAVCNGNAGAAEALLEVGADINARNKWGKTPLREAFRVNEAQVAHKLAALLRAFNRMRTAPPARARTTTVPIAPAPLRLCDAPPEGDESQG